MGILPVRLMQVNCTTAFGESQESPRRLLYLYLLLLDFRLSPANTAKSLKNFLTKPKRLRKFTHNIGLYFLVPIFDT